MAKVIGVRFRDNGKIYYFSSEQFEVEVGQNGYRRNCTWCGVWKSGTWKS